MQTHHTAHEHVTQTWADKPCMSNKHITAHQTTLKHELTTPCMCAVACEAPHYTYMFRQTCQAINLCIAYQLTSSESLLMPCRQHQLLSESLGGHCILAAEVTSPCSCCYSHSSYNALLMNTKTTPHHRLKL
ncbi:hypothetical protein ABBQ32_14121 [Trebouxia sp. C0010 RCD-2024]